MGAGWQVIAQLRQVRKEAAVSESLCSRLPNFLINFNFSISSPSIKFQVTQKLLKVAPMKLDLPVE